MAFTVAPFLCAVSIWRHFSQLSKQLSSMVSTVASLQLQFLLFDASQFYRNSSHVWRQQWLPYLEEFLLWDTSLN
jgi:hypothetical protein